MIPTRNERESVCLAEGYTIPRIIVGCWQLSGGHGDIAPELAIDNLKQFLAAGFNVFDGADIYTGVEELLGRFGTACRANNETERRDIKIHTKFVPDRGVLPNINKTYVQSIIDRSLARLQIERIDLVQFHWWDTEIPGYVETALALAGLQQEGKIAHLGLTNFDVPQVEEIISAGVPIVSNQVQFSLCDTRPRNAMLQHATIRNYRLLVYGTVAGGFLSERYLNVRQPGQPLENRSLVKYMLMIEELGGWDAFQSLLQVVNQIAHKHNSCIANVAVRYILDQDQVAAAIIGVRNCAHLERMLRLFELKLDAEDLKRIDDAINQLSTEMGGVYELERQNGKHAAIMKYDLNSTK